MIIMSESEKIKYRIFLNKLYELKTGLYDLLYKDNELRNKMKEIILVDDKIVEEEKVVNIFANDIKISNELENRIIPIVNNKC